MRRMHAHAVTMAAMLLLAGCRGGGKAGENPGAAPAPGAGKCEIAPGQLCAVVVPEGSAASRPAVTLCAQAFSAALGSGRRSVILLADAHATRFRGVGLWGMEVYGPERGALPVAVNDVRDIARSLGKSAAVDARLFGDERSFDASVAALSRLGEDRVDVVPVLLGVLDASDGDRVASALCGLMSARGCLLAVHTCMSAFVAEQQAAEADARTLASWSRLDGGLFPEASASFSGRLVSSPFSVWVGFQAVRAGGPAAARILGYRTHTTANLALGMGSMALVRLAPAAAGPAADASAVGAAVLTLARRVPHAQWGSASPPAEADYPNLGDARGVSVRITDGRRLVGTSLSFKPVARTLAGEIARHVAAAWKTSGERTPSPAERAGFLVDVAVLSDMSPPPEGFAFGAGIHGIYASVTDAMHVVHEGGFMPDFVASQGWDLQRAKTACMRTALQLDPNEWMHDATFLVFTVIHHSGPVEKP